MSRLGRLHVEQTEIAPRSAERIHLDGKVEVT